MSKLFKAIAKPEIFKNAYTDQAIYIKYKKAPVYYMLTRRGNAMELHARADGKDGILALRDAGRAVIEYVNKMYQWCEMLVVPVVGTRAYNQCKKLGFIDLGEHNFDNGVARVMVINYG